jgi:hypothetical protein
MNKTQKRFLLFFFVCMLIRLFIFYLSLRLDEKYILYMGLMTLIIGLSFSYAFLTNSRKTGILGDKVWWHSLRCVHAVIYLLYSFNAIVYRKSMSQLLLSDVIIGFISFLYYHYTTDPHLFKTLFSNI